MMVDLEEAKSEVLTIGDHHGCDHLVRFSIFDPP